MMRTAVGSGGVSPKLNAKSGYLPAIVLAAMFVCACGPSLPEVMVLGENRYAVETAIHAQDIAQATESAERFCAERHLGLVRGEIERGQTAVGRRGRLVTAPSLMNFSCAGERSFFATLPPNVSRTGAHFEGWIQRPLAEAQNLVLASPDLRRFCTQHEGRPNVVIVSAHASSRSETYVEFDCEGQIAPVTASASASP